MPPATSLPNLPFEVIIYLGELPTKPLQAQQFQPLPTLTGGTLQSLHHLMDGFSNSLVPFALGGAELEPVPQVWPHQR